ncbi:MAG: hypothetical protein ABFD90_16345 [Phycisphaerales bacterium]
MGRRRAESLREVVENEGRAVFRAQHQGSSRPAFTTADCTGATMITGADGVLVPQGTEEQKRKRRHTESAQQSRQGRCSTAAVGRPKAGSEGPYKESKVLTFYDPDKSHCHAVATSGNREVLGRLIGWIRICGIIATGSSLRRRNLCGASSPSGWR